MDGFEDLGIIVDILQFHQRKAGRMIRQIHAGTLPLQRLIAALVKIHVCQSFLGIFLDGLLGKALSSCLLHDPASAEMLVFAAEFCKAFSGGGHPAAAGCTVEGNLETVKEKLIKAAENVL